MSFNIPEYKYHQRKQDGRTNEAIRVQKFQTSIYFRWKKYIYLKIFVDTPIKKFMYRHG